MHFTLYATQQFKDDLQGFVGNPAVLQKLSKAFQYLENDPRNHDGSLRTRPLKRLQGSGEDVLKSRVDGSYRIMWCWDGPAAITLLRVGAHDFINNYASFDVTGLASAAPLRPDAGETAPSTQIDQDSYDYVAPGERIFGGWPAIHLRLLGVPEDRSRDVTLITNIEQVYDLGLPDYAEKNLTGAYLLTDWSSDDLFDSSFIFYRTNAKQLEGYCQGRIKQLLLNLSPEQDRLVHLQTTGPTLIKGVAGSGKTTVGIYRAMAQSYIRDLFRQDRDPRVLFVTYTETLARVVEQMFTELYGAEEAKRVEVWVLRDWLQAYLDGKPGARPLASRGEMDNAIGQSIYKARQQYPDSIMSQERDRGGKARGSEFFASEIADVIKGRGLQTWARYSKAKRTGRKTALGEHPRQFIWTVYEEYERHLEAKDRFDYLDLALHGIQCMQSDPDFEPYDAVIVDEAQDLRPVQLQVVSLLAGGAKARSLILLADPAQSIYYKGIPWKEGNVHIAGARSFSLRRNYRNTRQILEAAWSLATSGASDDPDEEAITPDVTDRAGPRPTVVVCQDSDFHDRYIVKTVEQLCGQMRFRLGDIAVLARRKRKVHHLRALLSRAGMPVVHFREEGFDIFENKVKAVTINSAKGLEFPVVFLADLDEGDLPRYLRVDDQDELEAELRSERRLMYVGMTRAASRLYLVCRQGNASRFLEEIDPDTIRLVHYEGVG
jgi:superfamily I DNA/RNA helicase